MSQSAKRPGVRDISDLKARLGLKKAAPAKPARGVVPPPGVKGAVPAPPGAQPAGPKVSDDPFGALNAAATSAARAPAHHGPEIVVIEKGEAVESVEHKATARRIAKIAGLILVPLVIGVAIGEIGTNSKQFNRTIHDAGKIAKEITKGRKALKGYQYAFQNAAEGGGFKAFDPDLTKKLEAIEASSFDDSVIYKSWLYELDPDLVADTLYFASEETKLFKDIKAHITLTKRDEKYLLAAKANKKKALPPENDTGTKYTPYRYAILLQVPTEQEAQQGSKPFGSQMVELGMPYCGDKISETGDCGTSSPSAFAYRTGPDEPWKKGEPQPAAGALENDKLLVLLPDGTMENLAKGSTPAYAEKEYLERVKHLSEKTAELVDLAGKLENDLKAKAGAGDKFTFFL